MPGCVAGCVAGGFGLAGAWLYMGRLKARVGRWVALGWIVAWGSGFERWTAEYKVTEMKVRWSRETYCPEWYVKLQRVAVISPVSVA